MTLRENFYVVNIFAKYISICYFNPFIIQFSNNITILLVGKQIVPIFRY